MTYRGRVRNGVVVLERASLLAEGTTVEVRPVASKNGGTGRRNGPRGARVGTAAAILPHVGTWAGDPAEVDRLLDELRRTKEAEVAARKAAIEDAGLSRILREARRKEANEPTVSHEEMMRRLGMKQPHARKARRSR